MKYVAVALLVLAAGAFAQNNVRVDLYYETLCPYSREYFTTQLYPTWLEMADIMDVALYPFGNANYYARTDGDGYLFTCQHGPDECTGNMIHACAQPIFNDINIEMPFVNCLLLANNPATAGEQCANEVGQDYTPIDACVNSVDGENALHAVALEQEKLDPTLEYVPWIVVDGVHNGGEQNICQLDMHACMCLTYQGTLPDTCAGITFYDHISRN